MVIFDLKKISLFTKETTLKCALYTSDMTIKITTKLLRLRKQQKGQLNLRLQAPSAYLKKKGNINANQGTDYKRNSSPSS